MMRAIFETLFDVFYLVSVIYLGISMIKNSKKEKEVFIFGIMAVVLGLGDSFHLVPRAYALCNTGLENFTYYLGIGKLVTSITMTIFYVLLFKVWTLRYKVKNETILTFVVYLLAITRIILCLFPQNMWTSLNAPLSWGIYRNIPFLILGILIIILFYKKSKEHNDVPFKNMWLTITLSFLFYIPVVLFADKYLMVGMLMIPKTCAYLWTVLIGYKAYKK